MIVGGEPLMTTIRSSRPLAAAINSFAIVALAASLVGCAATVGESAVRAPEITPSTSPMADSAMSPLAGGVTAHSAESMTADSAVPSASTLAAPITSGSAERNHSSAASISPPTGPITTVTVASTIATDLATPWGIGFLPDGTALVTERDTATLLAIAPDPAHTVRAVGVIEGVATGGEGGLLGLAVSPTFRADRTVFVYYTSARDNRVAAITLTDGAAAIESQRNILTGIPAASIHNGGRLLAARDGTLFIGTGDAAVADNAQRLDSLSGKILHVTATGAGAAGNPFPQAPLVYSYGHRNVQGLAFDESGRLWASEFGQNAYDELNLITPGGNYGWPIVEGPSDDPRYVAPYKYWPTSQASPSGLAIVGHTAFLAALRGQRLWLIPLTGPIGESQPVAALQGSYGRLRTVIAAPDGSVWLTTSNTDGRGTVRPGDDRILRLAVTRPS